MKKFLAITLIFAFAGLFFHSCKKDKGDPPALPPAESMFIDFSNFETGKKSEVSVPKGTETSSWEFAAGVAFFWNTVIYTTLAVPVKAFELATSNTPSYVEDKTWQWSYNATVLNVTYKARLTGQIRTSDVQWKMYIAREGTGGFSEFIWFEGTSDLDGTGGQWTLNQSSQSPVPILRIDWTKTGEAVGMIKCTYVKTGDAFKDSFIEYGLKSNAPLNAYYTIHIYNSTFQQFYDLDVEWSPSVHNGRVRCPAHFGNSDWYCWDSNYLNVDCP